MPVNVRREDLCEDAPIWTRQPRETPQAWDAFLAYRTVPARDRNTAAAAAKIGKSKETCRKWCKRWSWVDRANAYDRHLDSVRRATDEEKVQQIAERQAAELAVTLGALLQPAKALLEKLKVDQDFLKNVGAYDLARLSGYVARALPRIIEAERMVHGLPARVERHEQTGRGGGPIENVGHASEVHLYLPDNGRDGLPPDDAGKD